MRFHGLCAAACGWSVVVMLAAPPATLACQSKLEELEADLQNGAQENGEAEPGYLGLVADDSQTNGKGIEVVEIIADGPASQAGFEVGDVIVSAQGNAITTMDDLQALVEGTTPGEDREFLVIRNGKEVPLVVTFGQRPALGERRFPQFGPVEPEPGTAPPKKPGLGVRVVADEEMVAEGEPPLLGLRIQAVVEGSAAAAAELPQGGLIIAANGKPVRVPADLSKIVASLNGKGILELEIVVDGESSLFKVPIGGAKIEEDLPDPATEETPEQTIERLKSVIEKLEARIKELEDELATLKEPRDA